MHESIINELKLFLKKYQSNLNTYDIEKATELISINAVYIFTDGYFQGLKEIKNAFVKTWNTIEDETYSISNLEFIYVSESIGVCTYTFHSKGYIDGIVNEYSGRGTNVIQKEKGQWKIIHEHLSKID